jgi:ubiquinone/menaquinone biosynthesis C-methylase UbiE
MQQTTEVDLELARLEVEFRLRDSAKVLAGRYSLLNEPALLHSQSLECSLLTLLKRDLTTKKILDVCLSRGTLRRFLEYGTLPVNLSGIDLMAQRIEQAQHMHSTIDWRVESAHQLLYPDGSFDLVMSFVIFSSIFSDVLRQQVAEQMWLPRRPGGLVLVYDFSYSNPPNPAVQSISRWQLQQLFKRPGLDLIFDS